ncbi:hypothetical protein BXZ70DRAFT_953573 [Cristinia sonorae]|uniref:Uncharacterized protein n=1 Tax=Cristinia sonorae TaxID=1940300 RepID=A0A8K0XLP5_9AGAR|nr:hypothetical protein BXZ70DRAFT_953573 [Cristinia sonorae]
MFGPTAPTPTFEHLFSINVDMGDKHVVKASTGMRTSKPLLSGDVKDVSGEVVGHIVPNTSSSHGIVDAYGTYHPSVSMTIQWEEDKTFAYLDLSGVGTLGRPTTVYIHMEADTSSSYFWLNRRFMIGKVSHSPDGTLGYFDIFVLQESPVSEKPPVHLETTTTTEAAHDTPLIPVDATA